MLPSHIVTVILTSSILKNKIEKDNFGENHKKNKKNYVEKNCSNQQCFK
jgi:hypothetical protein